MSTQDVKTEMIFFVPSFYPQCSSVVKKYFTKIHEADTKFHEEAIIHLCILASLPSGREVCGEERNSLIHCIFTKKLILLRKSNLLLFFILLNIHLEAQLVKKVLFLGNSYTYVNDLPGLLSLIAQSKGDSVWHDQNTPGGCTFQMHCRDSVSRAKIAETNWDYVVLQEQSQLPSWPPDSVELLVYPYADTLTMLTRNNDSCSISLFFMTWGRENGDLDNCSWYPPVCTYEGMQARLRQSYLEMGQLFSGEVSPVGVAWKQTRTLYPSIELYAHDESHPSIYGSYLAACTFFGAIFHESPVGGYIPPQIPVDTAGLLQQVAYQMVFDSLPTWYIDTSQVHAGFFSTFIGGMTYQFTNTSQNAQSYYWDFGDQDHSTETNPTHTFPSYGNFLVTLLAERNCDMDTVSSIQNVVSGIPSMKHPGPVFYPNPASDELFVNEEWLRSFESSYYFVEDNTGKVISTGKLEQQNPYISLAGLAAGQYLIRVISNGKQIAETTVIRK